MVAGKRRGGGQPKEIVVALWYDPEHMFDSNLGQTSPDIGRSVWTRSNTTLPQRGTGIRQVGRSRRWICGDVGRWL